MYEVRISKGMVYIKTMLFDTFRGAYDYMEEFLAAWGNTYTLEIISEED